jgi:ACS family hexuronate transporter-like MFS transporter
MTQTGLSRYRWRILALIFFATTINYLDRGILTVLAPTLQYKVFHWTDQDFATINMAFKAAYGIGMLLMGSIIDRIGVRAGYAICIGIWSCFGMLHAAVRPAFSVLGFSLARFGLGLGESGNFPAAIKTVAEWFPKKERAYATGVFNAGSNVGAILAPAIIPFIVLPDGTHWQYAFLLTGGFSAIWIIAWIKMYRRPELHPGVSKAELAHIESDNVGDGADARKLPWSKVLPHRETWAFAVLKITDAVWWFYLFWGGKFLFDRFGLSISNLALPLIVIYVIADFGSIGGGWLSSKLISLGWTVNRARKTTLLICALLILPVVFVTQVGTLFKVDDGFFARLAANPAVTQADVLSRELEPLRGQSYHSAREFIQAVNTVISPSEETSLENALVVAARSDQKYWIAVLLISLGAAAHQAWSANVFTLVSDVFPKRAVASVTGIGGMVGAFAGMLADLRLGQVLTASGPAGYFVAFLAAGCCYLIVLGIAHLLMPTLRPLDVNLERKSA